MLVKSIHTTSALQKCNRVSVTRQWWHHSAGADFLHALFNRYYKIVTKKNVIYGFNVINS